MSSINSINRPLVYKVDPSSVEQKMPEHYGKYFIRTKTRALEGMQKEALVYDAPSGSYWRMVCDEGPYLNGTDLAPFPLAFFSAGMIFSIFENLLDQAKKADITVKDIRLVQENLYSMEGSAIRGDMTGAALPVQLTLEIEADVEKAVITNMAYKAIASCPVQSSMREILENTFTISHNGKKIETDKVKACNTVASADPGPEFDKLEMADESSYASEIIKKLESAETVFGVEGGAGSSLQAEQKRTLHVRAEAWLNKNGLAETKVQLFKPLGSVFRFLSDVSQTTGNKGRAPNGLSYLSAGIAFCYMTQLGRYAHIVKQDLQSYRIIQDTLFVPATNDKTAGVEPVETHVYVMSSEEDEQMQRLIDMGEQTCFLHAALRGCTKIKLKIDNKVGSE